jgi:hypothetical protein
MYLCLAKCSLGLFQWVAFSAKENCILAWPMYCHVLNLIKHVFCLFVIVGFFHKSFDITLFVSLFLSHLYIWCVWSDIVVRLCILSYLTMCFSRYLMGPYMCLLH